MVTLAKGTIEYLPIDVVDTLGTVTTLNGTGLKYDLYKDDPEETVVLIDVATNNNGLRALPLVDTSVLDEGEYCMWIHFDNVPEHPRLGPMKFRVD